LSTIALAKVGALVEWVRFAVLSSLNMRGVAPPLGGGGIIMVYFKNEDAKSNNTIVTIITMASPNIILFTSFLLLKNVIK
jgi:hypothetical protein